MRTPEEDFALTPIFAIGLTDRIAEKMEGSLKSVTGWSIADLRFGLSSPTHTTLEMVTRDDECEISIDIAWREGSQVDEAFEELSKTRDIVIHWDLHQRFMVFYSHGVFVELQKIAQWKTAELLAKLVIDSRPNN